MRKRETGLRERVTRKRRKWPWILLTILLLLILSVGAFWLKYGYEIRNTIADGYSYSQGLKVSDFHPSNSTVIYDRNGKEIKKLSRSSSSYTPIKDINPDIKRD